MVESQPDLASKLRRVRGGYLKIQGTWMPYEIALRLARRCVRGRPPTDQPTLARA